MDTFITQPGFCPVCGSIFPPLLPAGNIVCYNCKKEFKPDIFGDQIEEFTITFNNFDEKNFVREKRMQVTKEDPDGPIVERKCAKCGHDKMSYATIQLRSADEGQTVFFTCLKCKYKDSENS